MKLALGTAQFGSLYGIANQSGQVSREEVKEILAIARLNFIDTLDTAITYGESEVCLGEVGLDGFKEPSLEDLVEMVKEGKVGKEVLGDDADSLLQYGTPSQREKKLEDTGSLEIPVMPVSYTHLTLPTILLV